jgi:hypothetical protein
MALANLVSNAFVNVPYFGKRIKIARLNSVLLEIEHIKKQFNKPMVRFDDNIHALYDCLKGLDLTLQEDIGWFLDLDITCYSKTSTEAVTYLKRHVENAFPKEEHFFKNTSVGSLETGFMDWYSNYDTAQEFVDTFLYVIDLYCAENPRSSKRPVFDAEEQDDVFGTDVYTDSRKRELTQSMIEFFINQPFRLLLDDFLVLVEVVIYSQLRRLNG